MMIIILAVLIPMIFLYGSAFTIESMTALNELLIEEVQLRYFNEIRRGSVH